MPDGMRIAGGMPLADVRSLAGPQRSEMAPLPEAPGEPASPPERVADSAEAQSVKAFTGNTLGTGFRDLTPATDRDVYQFFAAMGPSAARSVVRSGDSLVIAVGDNVIKAQLGQLEVALGSGQIDKATPLAQSLQVYEAAYNAGLPNSAANAIVKAYARAVEAGTPLRDALAQCYTDIAVALQVEAYVENRDGLAQDMRATAEFTKQAFDGASAGGTLAAIKNRTVRADVIKTAQGHLDDKLSAFTNAFAQARETGDYGAAFDALQRFFQTSAAVTETDYWRQRPETVAVALENRHPAGPRDRQPPLALSRAADAQRPILNGRALVVTKAAPASPKGIFGALVETAKAGLMYVTGKAAKPVVGTIHSGSAHQMMRLQANAGDAVTVTGRIWKAPPPPPPPVVVAPRSVDGSEMPGVHVSDHRKGLVERRLLQTFQALVPGDSAELSGEAGLALGISINAIDFVPVVGEGLSSAVGLQARAGIGADAQAKVSAYVTRDDAGGYVAVVTQDYQGGASMAAGIGAKSLGLNLEGSDRSAMGHRRILTLNFANADDCAAFFAHPSTHGGRSKGDAAAPGTYSTDFQAENYVEATAEVASTRFVAPSEKSSGGILPGVRTRTDVSTLRMVDRGGEATLEELSFSVTTHAGTSSDGAAASKTSLEMTRHRRSDDTYALENAGLTLDLSIKKLQNLVRVGSEGERALNVLTAKLTERVNAVLREANAQGLDGLVDLTATEAAVRQTLTQLQARAASIFSGRGVSAQSAHGLMGLKYLSGDMASLRLTLTATDGGKLALSPPDIGVASTKQASVEVNVKEIVTVTAGVAYNGWRATPATAPEAVLPHRAPVVGTEVRASTKQSGLIYAVRVEDQGRTEYQNPVASLKMDYGDLIKAIKPDGAVADVNALVEKLVDNLVDDLLPAAQAKGFAGTIDREASAVAVRGALTLLRGQYEPLVGNRKKTEYTVPLDAFAARVQQRAFYRWDDKVKLDFRLEMDSASGHHRLINPLDVEANIERARLAAADERSGASRPPVSVHSRAAGEIFQAPGDEGQRTTFAVLKLDYGDLMKAIGPERSGPKLTALVDKLVTNLHEDLLVKAREQGHRGRLDPAETRTAVLGAIALLEARHDEITRQAKGKGFGIADGELPFTISGPAFAATIERRGPIRDDKVKLHFQVETLIERPDEQRLINPMAYAEHLNL